MSITDEDYCRRIAEAVFYSVEENLTDNGIDYIDEESAHIGDSGVVDLAVKSWKFLGGEQVRREDDDVTYVLKYHIDLEGESYCYSWKESQSGHLIRQEEYYPANHVFSGTVDVKVERKADILLDYENENSFEDAEIIDGSLEETEYLPYDEEENFDEDDVDVEFEVGGVIYTVNKKKDAYSVCSICGRPLSLVNDRGGVCDTCYCEYDI